MVDGSANGSEAADVLLARILASVVVTGLVPGAVRAEHALGMASGYVRWVAQQSWQAATDRLAVDVFAARLRSANVGLTGACFRFYRNKF